eukprot:Amastigsp_a514270_7.p2 type:complete len:135 gc:universal Amastigsp_a514270_7:1-405(+)
MGHDRGPRRRGARRRVPLGEVHLARGLPLGPPVRLPPRRHTARGLLLGDPLAERAPAVRRHPVRRARACGRARVCVGGVGHGAQAGQPAQARQQKALELDLGPQLLRLLRPGGHRPHPRAPQRRQVPQLHHAAL